MINRQLTAIPYRKTGRILITDYAAIDARNLVICVDASTMINKAIAIGGKPVEIIQLPRLLLYLPIPFLIGVVVFASVLYSSTTEREPFHA